MTDTFLFCGTGAADYVAPEEGKEFRKNTHSLLNDIILFDIGGMTYQFEEPTVISERLKNVQHVLLRIRTVTISACRRLNAWRRITVPSMCT